MSKPSALGLSRTPATGVTRRREGSTAAAETRRETFPALPPRLRPGDSLDGYRLEGEIARGGTAVIHRAREPGSGTAVALKILSPRLALIPAAALRFQAEAELAARVRDPSIIHVRSAGSACGHLYYAMDIHEGWPIRDFPAERRRLGFFERLATLFCGLAAAVERLHLQGIVHRDIKPDNLLLADGPRIVLADFGSALDSRNPRAELERCLYGTVRYMSPEQLAPGADPYDFGTDVYALGATLYEMATGARLFPGASEDEIVRRKLSGPPLEPRRVEPRLPLRLDAVIRRAMEPSTSLRHPSAGALAKDLQRCAGRP